MYDYNATITNVVDGDTYDVNIDLGFHIHIHERIRILDLDTPETRSKEKELGLICKQYAEKNSLNKKIVLKSEKEIQDDIQNNWFQTYYTQVLKKYMQNSLGK